MGGDDLGALLRALGEVLRSLTVALAVLGVHLVVFRRRTVTIPAVAAAGLLVAVVARAVGDPLSTAVSSQMTGARWVVAIVVAAAAAWGSIRLQRVDPHGPTVPALALAALVGIWAGVPETGPALAVSGLVLAVGLVVLRPPVGLSAGAAAALAVLVCAAGTAGAVGIPQALAGSWLSVAPLVLSALVPPTTAPSARSIAWASVTAATAALIAARHVGIERTWGETFPAIVVSLGLAGLSSALLRSDQLGS